MEKDKIALVLGGGGSRGAYQIGAWQALRDLDIRIDIVTGTSVGAINGALIVQDDFDLALKIWNELETRAVFDVEIKDIVAKRGVDCQGLQKILDEYISEDKIREAPLDYGIVTAQLPSFTPHYLFKEDIPKGKLRDYLLASSACFPALKSHVIDDVSFVDGGWIDNLPVGMALEKNAALIIAVDLDGIGFVDKKQLKQTEHLKIISSPWALGNLLVFDTDNTKRIMRLGYFDTMKAFHVFDGFYYTFAKNDFDKKMLRRADAAAKIFELDPLIIYKDFTLNRCIAEAIKKARAENKGAGRKSHALFVGNVLENLANASKKINRKILTILIAKILKEENAEKNLLFLKPVRRFLKEEILAASYLSQKKLI